MLNDPPIKTPAEQQELTVPPPAASVLHSLQNVVVTTLWSHWVLFEVLEKEIQLQRLLRQQSIFSRPPSTPNNKLQDNCNTTTATVQPCCSSFATFAVPVNDPNKNSDDEYTSNSAPTKSAKKVLPSPTHRHQAAGQKPKPSKNRYDAAFVSQPENDDECSSNSAPTETEEIATPSPTHRKPVAGHKPKLFRSKYDMTPSPTHRQQDTSQKRKQSKKRYDATLVSQPEDNDEYISKPTLAKTAEMETPSPTLRQHVAGQKPKPSGNRYDAALVSQPARYLPSSSKFDTGNVFNILRTRSARQTTTSKEPVSTLPRTKVSGNATQNQGTLPTAKQQHQPTSRRSPSSTSKYEIRLGYKKGSPNCRTRLQSAPRVHQYQPVSSPSNIWKVKPSPKVTASNSSQKETPTNNNTSLADDQRLMPQSTTTEKMPTPKLPVQQKKDNKVSWYVNAIGEFCLSNNNEAVQLTDAPRLTTMEIQKILYVKAETEYLIANSHLKAIDDSNSFYWLEDLVTS